jgi:hypothetical protein
MPFRFMTLQFEDILKRLFKSGHDLKCYQKLAERYGKDEGLNISNYKKARRKEGKIELLIRLSKNCTNLPKYEGYDYPEVILNAIYGTREIPATRRKEIFGYDNDEKEVASLIRKALKRNERDYEVIDTSDLARRSGRLGAKVRWADITLVKKTWRGWELCSFEVKVNPSGYDYFLNQAQAISLFSDYTFLACTPDLVLELAERRNMKPLQAEQYVKDSLERQGTGIYVIDITSGKLEPLLSASGCKCLDKEQKNRALKELRKLQK